MYHIPAWNWNDIFPEARSRTADLCKPALWSICPLSHTDTPELGGSGMQRSLEIGEEKAVERSASADRNKSCLEPELYKYVITTRGDLKIQIRTEELDFQDTTPGFF